MSNYQMYDTTTQRFLQELNNKMLMGNRDEVLEQINKIIKGAGYIDPLAEAYYRLAQNETDGRNISRVL
jgi:uncharacterized protein YaaQ